MLMPQGTNHSEALAISSALVANHTFSSNNNNDQRWGGWSPAWWPSNVRQPACGGVLIQSTCLAGCPPVGHPLPRASPMPQARSTRHTNPLDQPRQPYPLSTINTTLMTRHRITFYSLCTCTGWWVEVFAMSLTLQTQWRTYYFTLLYMGHLLYYYYYIIWGAFSLGYLFPLLLFRLYNLSRRQFSLATEIDYFPPWPHREYLSPVVCMGWTWGLQ